MNNFTYLDIEILLQRHHAYLDAAEAQGIATGMLCLDERVDANAWLEALFEQFEQPPVLSMSEQALLVALFQKTRALLLAESFEFDLFLPDGEVMMLSQQIEALCNWCRGFLLGVGYGAAGATWPGDSGEILKDIIEFTKLDTQSHAEGDERDLMEVHEYLRAAVMLFKDDLHGNNVLH